MLLSTTSTSEIKLQAGLNINNYGPFNRIYDMPTPMFNIISVK